MQPPWRFPVHEAVRAVIDVTRSLAWLGARALGAAPTVCGNGWVRFELPITNTDALIEWLLFMGPAARMVEPAALRERVRGILAACLAQHEGDHRAP